MKEATDMLRLFETMASLSETARAPGAVSHWREAAEVVEGVAARLAAAEARVEAAEQALTEARAELVAFPGFQDANAAGAKRIIDAYFARAALACPPQRPEPSGTFGGGYEREAADKARFRNDLHSFALWLSPTWDPENLDDVEAALRAVDTFIAAGCPPPESSQG